MCFPINHYPEMLPGGPGRPLHSASLGVDGGISALTEMYLLARCDTVIRFPPTSAFTRYARLFVPRVIEFDLKDPTRLILTDESSEHEPA
ncbi:nodulation NodZ domain-containing protein (plasmid) [Rhizobium sp. Kim5]|nr:nodulation NodZ domain-containing protein [Rhizobium sp. Kim5]